MIIAIRKHILNDSRGLSLVELMIAMVIAIIALAGTIKIFTTQQSLLEDENDGTKVRAKGRQAIKIIAREVRMAGFGLPKFQALDQTLMGAFPSPAVVDSISFRTNKDESNQLSRAYADPAGGIITDANTSVQVFALESGTSFSANDKIVIFNPSKVGSGCDITSPSCQVHEATVSGNVSSPATSIGFSPPLLSTKKIEFSANANLVMVNRYIDYTIALSGNQIIKSVKGIPTILVDNVAVTGSDGLKFHLLQDNGAAATDYNNVGVIRIVLNMIDPTNPEAAIEFTTDVQLRNSHT
jgi:Tfp pilus assembly protein PilW